MNCSRAAGDYVEDIANGGASRRRNDANTPGKDRQRTFKLLSKQALGPQAVAELLKGHTKRACAHRVEPSSIFTFVTTVTCSPASRKCSAAVSPATPEPITTTSVGSAQP